MLSVEKLRRICVSITAPLLAVALFVSLQALILHAPVQAEDKNAPQGYAFPLVVGTSLNPVGTNHDLYAIDVVGVVSQVISTTFPVSGATYDAVNDRVLFTSSAGSTNLDQLWVWPVGGTLNNLGTIVDASSVSQRIDGLAISGGVLYASYAGGTAEDGIWTIDMNTLTATLVYTFTDSVSGIDADPVTGDIYGVNDTAASLVLIDVAGKTMTPVAPYPVTATADIDGLAISKDGRAYLVNDEPGSIHVYNLNTASYEAPLTAPWTSADTFSGGAFIYSLEEPGIVIEKSPDNQTVFSGGDATFTISVTNTGNVTLTGVTVSDAIVPACDNSLGDMAPGASSSYGCADVGVTAGYTNTAEVTGTWNLTPITGTDTASVVVQPAPTIVVTKTVGVDPGACATTDVLDVGQPNTDVTYCYTVRNTGNVTLTTHDVVDDKLGSLRTGYLFDLGPGDTTFFTVTTNITQTVTNVMTWTASIPSGPSAMDSAMATVTEQPLLIWIPVFPYENSP